MKRKSILTLLAIISIICFVSAYACSSGSADFEAKFKPDAATEMSINGTLDLRDYIVRVDGASTKVEITYTNDLGGEMTEVLEGFNEIFYPKYRGEHVIKYYVTRNGATASATMTINVLAATPELKFSANPYIVSLNKNTTQFNIGFQLLMSNLNMYVRPYNLMPEVVKVEKAEYDFNIKYEDHEYTELYLAPGAGNYKFTEAGIYRFTAKVENDSGSTTACFYVLVEKGETSRAYKSSVAQDGTITIQAGNSFKSLGSWVTDYGYYGLGMYEVGDTLEFTFTGKNIPNVAILTDTNAYQPVGGGTGMYIQTSNNAEYWSNRLSITSPNRCETGNKNDYVNYDGYDLGKSQDNFAQDFSEPGNKSLFGYGMMEDNVDYRYTISTKESSIKGNIILSLKLEKYENDGYVELKTLEYDRATGLSSHEQTYAVAYSAGKYANKPISFKYEIKTDRRLNAYRNYDSEEITLTVPESGTETAYYTLGKYSVNDTLEFTFNGKNIPNVVLFSDTMGGGADSGKGIFIQTASAVTDDDSKTKIFGPNRYSESDCKYVYQESDAISRANLEEDKLYKYSIVATRQGLKLDLTLKLSVLENDSFVEVKTINTGFVDYGFTETPKSGYAIAYGNNLDVVFGQKITEFVDENMITLKKGTMTWGTNGSANSSNLSYTGLGAYESGDSLVFTFTGKNIPNVAIYTDSESGQAIGGGTGIYIQTSSTDPTWNKRVAVNGYYRLESGNPENYASYNNDQGGKNYTPGMRGEYANVADAIAYGVLTDDVDYRYTVSSTVSTGIQISLKLEKFEGDAYVTVKELNFSLTIDPAFDISGTTYAIAYGTPKADITFKYEKKGIEYTDITQENIEILKTATSGNFRLTEDIDLNGVDWNTANNSTTKFTGLLNGDGHTIKNLKTGGLFAIFAGTIKNLTIDNANFVTGQDGIIADRVDGGSLENVIIKTVNGTNSDLGGVLCRHLNIAPTLKDVVIIFSTIRNEGSTGFISGFSNKNLKVNCTNTYFIASTSGTGAVTPSGVRTGSYINTVDEMGENYADFLKGEYSIYSDVASFEAAGAKDNLNQTVRAMYDKLYPAAE